jgi:hypothetical protein
MSTPATGTPQTDTDEQAPPDSPLTTKEGWRRYVEHETHPPKLLTATERAALTARERAREDDRRREYHADLPLVNTPTIRKVISIARLLIQLNRHQVSARRGVILSGASGTGKATALTQLGRAHELATRKRHPHDRARLPVVYVTVPPAATPKMLASEFARFFGLTFPPRATHTDIVDAVCATAAHVHVDLVLVDELHNLNLGSRAGAEASDQLKYFAERLPGGMIGSLSQLVRGAAVLATEDGSEAITERLLELVPIDFAAEQSEQLTAPAKATGRRKRVA